MASNPNVPHNTEDKNWWLKHGEELEAKFCSDIAHQYGLKANINPEKKTDPTKPDLIVDDRISDLKVQNTPFFTASRFNKDPGRTITFNKIDLERYQKLYPDIDIYFYVQWTQLNYKHKSLGTIKVPPLNGLWKADLDLIIALVNKGAAPLHAYMRRKYDTSGNAKSSYLISLDDLVELKEIG